MSVIPRFYDIDRPFRMSERDFFRRPDFCNFNQMVRDDFFAPELFRPWDNVFRRWENYFQPMMELHNSMNRLAVNDVGHNITVDNEKFQVNVDVQHFSPEEINVKVIDGQVTIECKHEEKMDEHGYVSRQFVRKYALPRECLPDTVESKLSSDGVLTVTAPKVLPLPSTGEKIVPISYTGPVKKQLGSPEHE